MARRCSCLFPGDKGLVEPHDLDARATCPHLHVVRLYPSIFVNIGVIIGAADKGVQKCR